MTNKPLHPWVLVALLWGAALLNYLDRQVVFSVFPLLQRDLGATSFQQGLIGTVFLVCYGLVSPFGGYTADRIGRVRVILGSLILWSIGTWATGHVASITQMLCARALIGASEAFYLPAALALIADRHGPRTRSLATGIHQSGLYAGLAIGGAWGGWMGDTVGWRPAFNILGLAGIAYFAVLLVLFRWQPDRTGSTGFAGSVMPILRTGSFYLILTGSVSFSLANWLINTWLPTFLYERFHLTLGGAGFSATFYLQAASYAGVVIGGTVADRWTRTNPRARLYTQVIGLAFGAPFLAWVSVAGSLPVTLMALAVFGLGRGAYDSNAMPVLREVTGDSRSATAYGLLNMAGTIAGGAEVAAAGYLKQHIGLGGAFQFAAGALLVGSMVLLSVRTRSTKVETL